MEDNQTKSGKNQGYSHYLIIILVAPLLYVFSIFPVVLIVKFTGSEGNQSLKTILEAFYAPVIWAMDNSDLFKDFMEKIAQALGLN